MDGFYGGIPTIFRHAQSSSQRFNGGSPGVFAPAAPNLVGSGRTVLVGVQLQSQLSVGLTKKTHRPVP